MFVQLVEEMADGQQAFVFGQASAKGVVLFLLLEGHFGLGVLFYC
jgi:hypothetical protein